MKILYLIGNGFDINLGIKSEFVNYYKYYLSVNSDNEIIKQLKEEIKNNIDVWSDLELKLGDYCKNIQNVEELDLVIEDLGENLADYLIREETNFDFSKIDEKELMNNLAFPENFLPIADKNELKEFKEIWKNSNWIVNIITFNYTNSLEHILGENYNGLKLAMRNNKLISLNKIEHIHGHYDSRMVMGVNDVSQINNQAFHNNIDILESIVKPDVNRAVKDSRDDWCKNEISNANLICMFGLSIGDTDIFWWNLLGQRLLQPHAKLIIFSRSKVKIPSRTIQKVQREVRSKSKEFLNKTKLSKDEKEKVLSNIYVSINSNIFNIKKA